MGHSNDLLLSNLKMMVASSSLVYNVLLWQGPGEHFYLATGKRTAEENSKQNREKNDFLERDNFINQ